MLLEVSDASGPTTTISTAIHTMTSTAIHTMTSSAIDTTSSNTTTSSAHSKKRTLTGEVDADVDSAVAKKQKKRDRGVEGSTAASDASHASAAKEPRGLSEGVVDVVDVVDVVEVAMVTEPRATSESGAVSDAVVLVVLDEGFAVAGEVEVSAADSSSSRAGLEEETAETSENASSSRANADAVEIIAEEARIEVMEAVGNIVDGFDLDESLDFQNSPELEGEGEGEASDLAPAVEFDIDVDRRSQLLVFRGNVPRYALHNYRRSDTPLNSLPHGPPPPQ